MPYVIYRAVLKVTLDITENFVKVTPEITGHMKLTLGILYFMIKSIKKIIGIIMGSFKTYIKYYTKI